MRQASRLGLVQLYSDFRLSHIQNDVCCDCRLRRRPLLCCHCKAAIARLIEGVSIDGEEGVYLFVSAMAFPSSSPLSRQYLRVRNRRNWEFLLSHCVSSLLLLFGQHGRNQGIWNAKARRRRPFGPVRRTFIPPTAHHGSTNMVQGPDTLLRLSCPYCDNWPYALRFPPSRAKHASRSAHMQEEESV